MKRYSEGEVFKALQERMTGPRGMTQAAIAKELGFTPQFLNDVVGGRRPITTNLANALGFRELPREFVKFKEAKTERVA